MILNTPALGISYPSLQYYDVSDVGLPSKKVVASGKNGDDGDLLLFRDGPGACDV
ncbi:hypothetical protein Tco_0289028, partial [Tanacetum coccineum]